MLPYLKKDQDAAVSAPVEPVKRKPDEDEEYDGLQACAHELIAALADKDAAAVASALRAAFDICESEPHTEGDLV